MVIKIDLRVKNFPIIDANTRMVMSTTGFYLDTISWIYAEIGYVQQYEIHSNETYFSRIFFKTDFVIINTVTYRL